MTEISFSQVPSLAALGLSHLLCIVLGLINLTLLIEIIAQL